MTKNYNQMVNQMFLKELKIRNFRSIKDITLNFSSEINILIGENNSKKQHSSMF